MRDQAEKLLATAVTCFWEAGHRHALMKTAAGLDALVHASELAEIAADFPALAVQTREALEKAVSFCAATVDGKMTAERIHLLAAGAAGLLRPDDGLKADRQLYAFSLRYELSAIAVRQELSARGDPILRSYAIERALAAQAPAQDLH